MVQIADDESQEEYEDEGPTSAEEWLALALTKQFPGIPLCDCLGYSAPSIPEFWSEFAELLHREGLHWDAADAWRRASDSAKDEDSAYSTLMDAAQTCWAICNSGELDVTTPIELFEDAARKRPDLIEPQIWLAYLRSISGSEEKALDAVHRALVLSNGSDLDWSGIDTHQHALSGAPSYTYLDNAKIHHIVDWAELAMALLARDRNEEAIQACVQDIRFSADPAQAIAQAAVMLSDANLLPDASAQYNFDRDS